MKFKPFNKYLLVEKIEEQVSHLIPEHLRNDVSPFTTVNVLDVADDCVHIVPQGEIGDLKVVVQTNGLEKVKMLRDEFLIVPERFVVGVLEE